MIPLNRIERTYRSLLQRGKPVTKLFTGNANNHGFRFPPEILKESYTRYLEKQIYHPHPKGLEEARAAIARYYREEGALVDPENILLTAGTSESFFYLFSFLAGRGGNILTPNPSYPLFDHIAHLAGVELRHYPLQEDREWRIGVEALQAGADANTKALVLISPHNPTGAVISRGEIEEIVEWANRRDIPLICDEVFSEFYYGDGLFPRVMTVAKPSLGFTLNGISKMFALPALKLGWIAVTGEQEKVEPIVDALETTADTFLSVHTPIQEALPSLFEQGMRFVRSFREEVGKRRKLAMEILSKSDKIRFVAPQGGFYLTAEILDESKGSEEEWVIQLMEEEGIFVHPGYFYDYEKGIHIVISYLTRPDILQRGLEAILRFVM